MTDPRIPDLSLLRGATQRRLSRRDLFRYAGVGAGSVGMASILAACSTKGTAASGSATPGAEGTAEWWAQEEQADLTGTNVNFTNWPQYIDHNRDADTGAFVYPTLDAFTEETGINVTYRNDIDDNTQFYATIRPDLEAGNDTGHDIIVITNGSVLTELIESNYLIQLDQSLLTNFHAQADPTVADPSYDPGNKYTIAWQSGFTGIGWNTKYVDKEITSFMDLFDEQYSGHIGMFGDPADLPNMAILATGKDPGTSTPDDWQAAADLLNQQKESGVVRKYYVQDYLEAFENEDIWLTMAWSGDILIDKLYYPDDYSTFEFTLPSEGGIIWTDNMCIPAHAANPVGALMLMDHWYDPRIAATLTEYNNYVSPVPAGKPLIEKDAKAETDPDYKSILEEVLSSPYVFPDEQVQSMVHRYRVLTADEEQQWNDIFTPIYQG